MKTATLELVSSGDRIDFRLSGQGVPPTLTLPGSTRQAALKLADDLEADENLDYERRTRLMRRYAEANVPATFTTWFREWSGDPAKESVLCVYADNARVSALPWAELLMPSNVRPGFGWVARVCSTDAPLAPLGPPPPPPPNHLDLPAKLLFAAWAHLTQQPMEGIERESREFLAKVDRERFEVRRLPDPPRAVFLEACREFAPRILHLSPPSLVSEDNGLALPVTPENPPAVVPSQPPGPQVAGAVDSVVLKPQFDLVTLAALAGELATHAACRVVFLNACFAGGPGCQELAHTLCAITLGWSALVTDDMSADFAFHFYERLREGVTPIAAVRQFAQNVWTSRAGVEFPVVWLPSPAWAEWVPMPTPPLPQPPPPPPLTTTTEAPVVTLAFEPQPYVNPALLVNLHPAIKHLNLAAPTALVGQTVNLCIVCDTGSGSSAFRRSVKLTSETTSVPPEDVVFPAMHELVDRRAHRRNINFTATVTDGSGREVAVQTKTAIWMGATEWLNLPETWEFIPAFVDPLDAGVRSIFGEATRILRTLGTPQDKFNGYLQPLPSAQDVEKQVRAIYQALRDGSQRLTYINPPGSPLFAGDKPTPVGQFIRTHGEVVTHRLGTCHDLALLMAACAEYIGIRPLVILFSGHTFVGFWTTLKAQDDYWKGRKITTTKQWTILDGPELLNLVKAGHVLVVETTMLGDPDKSFDEACQDRVKYLEQWRDLLNVAIDVYRARTHSIRPV